MNKQWLSITGLALISLVTIPFLTGCASPAAAQSGTPTVQINQQSAGFWVTGKGEITVSPNLATVSIGVESMKANVADAQAEASDGIKKVMKALTDSSIDQKDIQTESFNIYQRLDYNSYSYLNSIVGYTVTNMLTVKIRDMDKVGDIINAAVAAGGDLIRINSLSFSVEDPSEIYKQAREKATANAKDKAEQYARLMGVKLGSPTYVSESTDQSNPYYYGNYYSGNAMVPAVIPSYDSSISPGQNKITLSITVSYEMIK